MGYANNEFTKQQLDLKEVYVRTGGSQQYFPASVFGTRSC